MKKLYFMLLAIIFAASVEAQTFPVQNLYVGGTSTFVGPAGFGSSAAFTVSPTMPTAATGTSNTQGATTAFVNNAINSVVSLYAPLASPSFTGQVSMATPAAVPSTCSNILAYGGVANGTTDNTAAMTAALAASPVASPCVYFPPGVFAFASGITWSAPTYTAAITILGSGSDVTILKWAGGQGITLRLSGPSNSVHVRNMSMVNGAANSGTALSINLVNTSLNPANTALSDVTGVTFRGGDGYALTDYWATGISVNGASNINFTSLSFVGSSSVAGIGVALAGTSSIIPVEFNFQTNSFYGLFYGIQYGNYVQGVTVNQSNFTNVDYGISSASGLTALAQLTIVGSQFNCLANGISLLSNPAPGILIEGNLILVPNGAIGISLTSAGLYSIIGNSFFNANSTPSGNTGIYIVSSTAPGVLSGNTIYGMAGNGIVLGSSSHNVNVQSNAYSSNGANLVNNGTSNTIGGGSQ
jgi:hypothetical protein